MKVDSWMGAPVQSYGDNESCKHNYFYHCAAPVQELLIHDGYPNNDFDESVLPSLPANTRFIVVEVDARKPDTCEAAIQTCQEEEMHRRSMAGDTPGPTSNTLDNLTDGSDAGKHYEKGPPQECDTGSDSGFDAGGSSLHPSEAELAAYEAEESSDEYVCEIDNDGEAIRTLAHPEFSGATGPPECGFAMGDTVVIHGLNAAKSLNGRVGRVFAFFSDSQRFAVRIAEACKHNPRLVMLTAEAKLLKTSNLEWSEPTCLNDSEYIPAPWRVRRTWCQAPVRKGLLLGSVTWVDRAYLRGEQHACDLRNSQMYTIRYENGDFEWVDRPNLLSLSGNESAVT
ncbi:unnamed protein product [Polarella glacialis]|uniref:Uncharacterized protein n=1 Tax=Polarella glacialis TaxID=89957 RepID=A0A813KJ09_POLGL|nr:unnamed protein product [Polarella glacialis]